MTKTENAIRCWNELSALKAQLNNGSDRDFRKTLQAARRAWQEATSDLSIAEAKAVEDAIAR